jgi:hypothetical protein
LPAASGFAATAVAGSKPVCCLAQYVYPTNGQDSAKQASDEADCTAWAKQQTGFDPATAVAANPLAAGNPLGGTNPLAAAPSGGLGGTAEVAALGALAGGGGGLGSAAGLMTGGGGGTAGTAMQAAGALTQAMGQQQPHKPGQAEFDQARAACLSGRGYSVK